jgi:UDP-glucose 4-epimerase
MNILVTGGSGFIGGELAGQLISKGHRVVIPARRPGTPRPRLTWVEANLAQEGWTKALPEDIDAVAHMAQSRLYRDFPNGAKDIYAVNVHAAFELAEWCRRHTIGRLVNAGTGSIYQSSPAPAKEDHPTQATNLYQATKLAAETILEQYGSLFPVTCCRIFTVYGPGQRGMLLANMIQAVTTGQQITLAQGIGPVMSPVHVVDVAKAFVALLEADNAPKRINIAGPVATLRQCVEHIARGLDKTPNILETNADPLYATGDDTLFSALIPDALPPEALADVAREETF